MIVLTFNALFVSSETAIPTPKPLSATAYTEVASAVAQSSDMTVPDKTKKGCCTQPKKHDSRTKQVTQPLQAHRSLLKVH